MAHFSRQVKDTAPQNHHSITKRHFSIDQFSRGIPFRSSAADAKHTPPLSPGNLPKNDAPETVQQSKGVENFYYFQFQVSILEVYESGGDNEKARTCVSGSARDYKAALLFVNYIDIISAARFHTRNRCERIVQLGVTPAPQANLIPISETSATIMNVRKLQLEDTIWSFCRLTPPDDDFFQAQMCTFSPGNVIRTTFTCYKKDEAKNRTVCPEVQRSFAYATFANPEVQCSFTYVAFINPEVGELGKECKNRLLVFVFFLDICAFGSKSVGQVIFQSNFRCESRNKSLRVRKSPPRSIIQPADRGDSSGCGEEGPINSEEGHSSNSGLGIPVLRSVIIHLQEQQRRLRRNILIPAAISGLEF
ncbi:hypothetical protein GEV33_011443 [Tenebrio molitor]|uniref:Uncharacterized protein n=1 Tax=Tenebrio molitor TaxID=7067 RepID=A0A8J6HBH9_TENMO|nr:hypothetical protein GEV33_011443 [Tenebrio molitor]